MKAKLTYRNQFFIQEKLPHAADKVEYADDIFNDDIYVEDGKLVLETLCGKTVFESFTEVPGGFLVTGEFDEQECFWSVRAEYSGAYGALNSCTGVHFPFCWLDDIESSIGKFSSEYGYAKMAYEVARALADLSSEYDGESAELLQERLRNLSKGGMQIELASKWQVGIREMDRIPEPFRSRAEWDEATRCYVVLVTTDEYKWG